MQENPYAAPQEIDEKEEHLPPPRAERVRGWRVWLILFSSIIFVLCAIGWLLGLLTFFMESEMITRLSRLNMIANAMAGLFYVPYWFVVYRLARAMGRTRVKAILYMLLGGFTIYLEESDYGFLVPLGVLIATFWLNGLAKEIIDNSQAEYQNIDTM